MIITLCGSSRFEKHFKIWNEVLSLAGHEVFGLSAYPSDYAGVKSWYSDEQKIILDQVHKRKIDASDAIVVLNVHAYIGDSTMSEIEHAFTKGKKVYPLETWAKGNGVDDMHHNSLREDKLSYGIASNYASPLNTHVKPFEGQARYSTLLGLVCKDRSALINRLRVLES